MKTLLLFSLLIFHFSLPIFPQMAQRLEQILERPAVDYQEAVLLVLEATDRFGPEVTGNADIIGPASLAVPNPVLQVQYNGSSVNIQLDVVL